jgi:hypothetical protein
MATGMADGRGNLGAGRQHRGAFPGQEQGHVQFPLQRAGDVWADGGRAGRHLRDHRRGAEVDDHIRAIGEDHRGGTGQAPLSTGQDGGAHRSIGHGQGHALVSRKAY